MTLKDFLNSNDRFAARSGCRIEEIGEGRARAVMTVESWHLNGGGVCQGGALFTLADLALAAVMNSRGQLTLSIQSSVMFLGSAHEGDVLTAEAVEVLDHRRIPCVEVRVTAPDGSLLCLVTALAYRKQGSLPVGGLM